MRRWTPPSAANIPAARGPSATSATRQTLTLSGRAPFWAAAQQIVQRLTRRVQDSARGGALIHVENARGAPQNGRGRPTAPRRSVGVGRASRCEPRHRPSGRGQRRHTPAGPCARFRPARGRAVGSDMFSARRAAARAGRRSLRAAVPCLAGHVLWEGARVHPARPPNLPNPPRIANFCSRARSA